MPTWDIPRRDFLSADRTGPAVGKVSKRGEEKKKKKKKKASSLIWYIWTRWLGLSSRGSSPILIHFLKDAVHTHTHTHSKATSKSETTRPCLASGGGASMSGPWRAPMSGGDAPQRLAHLPERRRRRKRAIKLFQNNRA